MYKHKAFHKESGNTVVIVLVVLVVVAVGALAYLSGHMADGNKKSGISAAEPAGGQTADAGSQTVIKPGNPVVAKLNGEDITRLDVFNFIQTLPPQTRQLPVDQLFPLAVEQVINARLIQKKTDNVNLDNDPEVKKQLKAAKDNIVRTVYIQNEVTKGVTEDRLKEAYELYKQNFPDVDEVKASHILVKEEGEARDLIKKLKGGADFGALAKENSIDGTAKTGGDLGYFSKTDVVPEFAESAFSTEPGSYTDKPVKSDFGYHIIKVEEKRKRPPASMEESKPFLETQLRRMVLDQLIQEWREKASIERFNINGDPIEPAAGDEAPAAAAN